MNKLETLVAGLTACTVLSVIGAKTPEVISCEDQLGNDKTEWVAGVIPRCDPENLTPSGTFHRSLGMLASGGFFVLTATASSPFFAKREDY